MAESFEDFNPGDSHADRGCSEQITGSVRVKGNIQN